MFTEHLHPSSALASLGEFIKDTNKVAESHKGRDRDVQVNVPQLALHLKKKKKKDCFVVFVDVYVVHTPTVVDFKLPTCHHPT